MVKPQTEHRPVTRRKGDFTACRHKRLFDCRSPREIEEGTDANATTYLEYGMGEAVGDVNSTPEVSPSKEHIQRRRWMWGHSICCHGWVDCVKANEMCQKGFRNSVKLGVGDIRRLARDTSLVESEESLPGQMMMKVGNSPLSMPWAQGRMAYYSFWCRSRCICSWVADRSTASVHNTLAWRLPTWPQHAFLKSGCQVDTSPDLLGRVTILEYVLVNSRKCYCSRDHGTSRQWAVMGRARWAQVNHLGTSFEDSEGCFKRSTIGNHFLHHTDRFGRLFPGHVSPNGSFFSSNTHLCWHHATPDPHKAIVVDLGRNSTLKVHENQPTHEAVAEKALTRSKTLQSCERGRIRRVVVARGPLTFPSRRVT